MKKDKNLIERDRFIVKRYKEGDVTMKILAERNGITRQRVEQILRANGVEKGSRPRKQEVEYTCKECGKNFKSLNRKRVYCSVECSSLGRRKYKTKEEIKAHKEQLRKKYAQKSRKYYHEVFKKLPNWREIVRERNAKKRKN